MTPMSLFSTPHPLKASGSYRMGSQNAVDPNLFTATALSIVFFFLITNVTLWNILSAKLHLVITDSWSFF